MVGVPDNVGVAAVAAAVGAWGVVVVAVAHGAGVKVVVGGAEDDVRDAVVAAAAVDGAADVQGARWARECHVVGVRRIIGRRRGLPVSSSARQTSLRWCPYGQNAAVVHRASPPPPCPRHRHHSHRHPPPLARLPPPPKSAAVGPARRRCQRSPPPRGGGEHELPP